MTVGDKKDPKPDSTITSTDTSTSTSKNQKKTFYYDKIKYLPYF